MEKMRKPKLYLETSVWNFYYADDAPDFMEVTRRFFNQVSEDNFDIYISRVVLDEVEKASLEIQDKLGRLIKQYKPKLLLLEEVADDLAYDYIDSDVLTLKSLEDCRHAAIATVNELDYLLSWNMRHLANANRMQGINAVNIRNGYTKKLELVTPAVMSEYE